MRWRIWDKLNPQNIVGIKKIMKDMEEELGKRKIGVLEEEDQLKWGTKNGGELKLKEERYYIAGQDQENSEQH
jgi:hypothetical protein